MTRKEFGRLIAALRQALYDPEADKRWTQAKLAREANESVKVIGDIERGQRAHLGAELLERLGRALQLNAAELDTLFALAATVGRTPPPHDPPKTILKKALGRLHATQLPAVLHDSLSNLVAYNAAWLQLHQLDDWFGTADPFRYNFPYLVFTPDSPLEAILGDEFGHMQVAAVYYFRVLSLPHRHAPYYEALRKSLSTSKAFKEGWQITQDPAFALDPTWRIFTYSHPTFGDLSYRMLADTTYTAYGNLHLALLAPASRPTRDLFYGMMIRGGDCLTRGVEWPDASWWEGYDEDEVDEED